MSTGRVRPFREDDIPAVADIFEKVFRKDKKPAEESLKDYFRQVYFENPWRDPELPSLVYEAESNVRGFLGVLPMRLSSRGQTYWAAIGGNFMVDPTERDPFGGIQILKNFFGGKQDISMTDTGNEKARKMWEGLGGVTSPAYSMHWIRMLRPLRLGMSFLRQKKALMPVEWLGRPFASVIDRLLARSINTPLKLLSSEKERSELTDQELLGVLDRLSRKGMLSPSYDFNSLTWFIRKAEEKKVFGSLLKRAVREKDGSIAGWFLYYPNPGGIGQVLQFGSLRRSVDEVLDALLEDAWSNGSIALVGRAEPRDIKVFSSRNCLFFHRSNYFLMHSANAALIQAIQSGKANLSRMEGDWWTRFQGDTFEEELKPIS